MNKINYQQEMEKTIRTCCSPDAPAPKLLLHSCCGPCSSYCIDVLSRYFEVTVFYYNPNIYPEEEYYMRVKEQKRFIDSFPTLHPVSFLEGKYDTERFYEMARGMEQIPEGGERCFRCYRLRLEEAAQKAKELEFDFFTTTLSISPLKNSQKLNEIGKELEEKYQVRYLYSDFKKKNGYKRSTEISREYQMYRQYYCGCVYSKQQRDREIAAKQDQEKTQKTCEVCS